jgi:hypothetical protein
VRARLEAGDHALDFGPAHADSYGVARRRRKTGQTNWPWSGFVLPIELNIDQSGACVPARRSRHAHIIDRSPPDKSAVETSLWALHDRKTQGDFPGVIDNVVVVRRLRAIGARRPNLVLQGVPGGTMSDRVS